MRHARTHIATIELDDHESVELLLEREGDRYATYIRINEVDCELLYLPVVLAEGLLHGDPGYVPTSDSKGYTYLLIPFSR